MDAELNDALDTLWRGLRAELTPAAEPDLTAVRALKSPRRRPVYAGAVAAGLLAVAGVGGVVAAGGGPGRSPAVATGRDTQRAGSVTYQHAHTHQFATGKDAPLGEWLEQSAADMPAVIRSLTRDIPFAPGYGSYRTYTYDVYLTSPTQVQITTGLARAEVAHQAICSWADYWVGTPQGRPEATKVLEGSTQWSAVRTIDPTLHDQFRYLPGVVAAVRSGSASAVARSLFDDGATYCVPEQLRAIDGERLLRESRR